MNMQEASSRIPEFQPESSGAPHRGESLLRPCGLLLAASSHVA